jgi:uncharacterized metal-binding protein
MTKKCGCDSGCGSGSKLIFSCSGAADVGGVVDQASRRLNAEGIGKMYCLAGIGGRVSGIVEYTKAASQVLAIDGCPLNCVKNTLEQAGFTKFDHLMIDDIGMKKGKTPATEENIARVATTGMEMLA